MNSQTPETRESRWADEKEELQEPPMYKVFLHNDDYTSMDFVVDILKFVFNKSTEEAIQIMLKVHEEGIGLCGVYTYEVAETKVDMVHHLAEEKEFPLKSSMEKA